MANPLTEMVRAVSGMMTNRSGRRLQVHEGMIQAYINNNNVSREEAISVLVSQGLIPSLNKKEKQ